jgi:hypothetical protein
MGPPVEEGTSSRNEAVLKNIKYHHWSGTGYERAQLFFFVNDVLVGHSYSSTTDDSTNFDATRVNLIRKGESTDREVIALLGPFSGRSSTRS